MSMNLPVVAPDDLARREIIGEAGLFCDVENPREYAECLIRALNIEWRDIPRNRAVSQFSWNKISLDYKKLIIDVCS
jgi:glycosyltransferase involved in cell wall biosynthesis